MPIINPDIMIMNLIVTIHLWFGMSIVSQICGVSFVTFEIQTNLFGDKNVFFNKKFLQTRSVRYLITSKCILLPAFLKERMNQVKNRYAEIVEQRSYKSILKATQAKNSNIYNQIKCVLEYSKNICKEWTTK